MTPTRSHSMPDLDAAIGWARQCPAALYGAVEIRPSAVIFRDGQWQTPGSETAQA
ncbi:hypothetical protein [Cryobacterium sp. N19]|uniref:hypothetical protein n=1 Tax=Cryobacterium sp. N19 TaxID=2048288 RepID=UPI0018ED8D1D|nr:hypothetical protein [Cryobacterium sp. N19]